MKKNIITLCLSIIILSVQLEIYTQTHIIFLDDSTFYTKNRFIQLKDSLDNGMWILHKVFRKDSTKANEQTILVTGNFKEHRREGVFNYYTDGLLTKKSKKKEHYVWYSETYKSNLLDGMVVMRASHINIPVRETMYKDGKKNGLDILYYTKEKKCEDIACINYFKDDTLLYQTEYKYDKSKFVSGALIYTGNDEYIRIDYDLIGQTEYISFFKNYKLYKRQKFYSNQIMEIESEGDFQYSIEDFVANLTHSYNKYYHGLRRHYRVNIINGIERIYNQNGELIEERIINQ